MRAISITTIAMYVSIAVGFTLHGVLIMLRHISDLSTLYGVAVFFDLLFLFFVFVYSQLTEYHPPKVEVEDHNERCHFCSGHLKERPASEVEQKAFHLDTIVECSNCGEIYEEVVA